MRTHVRLEYNAKEHPEFHDMIMDKFGMDQPVEVVQWLTAPREGETERHLKKAEQDVQDLGNLTVELREKVKVLEANMKVIVEEAIVLRHKWAIAQEFISADDFPEYEKDLRAYDNLEHHLINSSRGSV